MTDVADRAEVDSLIAKEKYLDAAEIIKASVDPGDFHYVLRDTLSDDFAASEMHRAIYDMDPKIVITTNYDQIYEKYCGKYASKPFYNTVKQSDSNILDDIRSETRLLIKAHGCLSSVGNVVLGRSSYFEAKRDYTAFYNLLDALFLTHTILFLGASLSDPDIQLVLENATISAPCEKKHYAVIPSGTHTSVLRSAERSYNMRFLEYAKGDYVELNTALTELAKQVQLAKS